MHVAEAGPCDGRPVLALHGWPQHWYMWRALVPPLAGRGFRLICPDLRGQGWSGWPPDGDFAKSRLVDDVLALLDALDIASAGVIGHDWGGWVTFLLARRAPHRITRLMALSIVAPWNRGRGVGVRDLAFAYQPLLALPAIGPAIVRNPRAMAALMRTATGRGHSWDEGALEPYLAVLGVPRVAEASSRLYRSFLACELHRLGGSTGADAEPLAMPVLQMVGARDLVRSRLDRARAPRAERWRVERVPDCGHFMLDERPGLVAARALAFFTDG